MLGRDSCGCVYLTAGKTGTLGHTVFCVSACDADRDDDPWSFREGWRGNADYDRGEPRDLEPITGVAAQRVFREWSDLIADGYAARAMARAVSAVELRRTQARERDK